LIGRNVPIAKIAFKYRENERKMMTEMYQTAAAILKEAKAEILPYLERLRDDSKLPMIYVSHDAGEVARIATHVVRLEGGRIVASGGAEVLAGR